MLNSIKKALQELFNRNATPLAKRGLPRAVPSAEEAIIPFNPAEHAIQPQSLKRLIESGRDIVLLDVREAWEYEIAHLKGAKQISIGELPQQASLLNPYGEIVAYCHKGMPVHLLQLRCSASATTTRIQANQEFGWRYRSVGEGN